MVYHPTLVCTVVTTLCCKYHHVSRPDNSPNTSFPSYSTDRSASPYQLDGVSSSLSPYHTRTSGPLSLACYLFEQHLSSFHDGSFFDDPSGLFAVSLPTSGRSLPTLLHHQVSPGLHITLSSLVYPVAFSTCVLLLGQVDVLFLWRIHSAIYTVKRVFKV